MKPDELLQNRYVKDIGKNIVLIAMIISLIMFWCFIYLIFVYQPSYMSTAKILIKEVSQDTFVTPSFATEDTMKPLMASGNPLLTQMEIIKSKSLENKVNEFIAKFIPDKKKEINLDESLKYKNKIGTDIIEVGLVWDNPEESKLLLEYILKEYEKINLDIAKKIKVQKREYIDSKISEIQPKLIEIRQKIRLYNAKNLTGSLTEESSQLIAQKVNLKTQLDEVDANFSRINGEMNSIQRQIGLKPSEAIQAVALGSENTTLVNLKNALNEETQKYEFDGTRLAETNPSMMAQKNKIEEIKKQIQDQILLSIGKKMKKGSINVYDPVREKLIQDMVSYQAQAIGLNAEKNSIQKSVETLEKYQSEMPLKKFELDEMLQEEKALSNAFSQLRDKQIEAKIQEAETVSNISIIDTPTIPKGQSFPLPIHIILIAFVFGSTLGVIFSFLKTYLQDICDDNDYIEKITGTNIIGTIPWYNDFDDINKDEDKMEFMDKIAYNNIISNLLVKCYKHNAKILTFTSTSIQKPQSALLYKIASILTRLGHSVLIMDTDFRIPSISTSAKIDNKITKNLSELILEIEEKIKKNQNYSEQNILSAVVKNEAGINFLANTTTVFEPYEFFGTMAYKYIMTVVKEKFDWVLIDSSSAHISPEFKIISQRSDGVIIFINKTATYSDLNNLTKSLKTSAIPIIGTIIRKPDSKLEREYEKYLRHQLEKFGETNALDDFSEGEEFAL